MAGRPPRDARPCAGATARAAWRGCLLAASMLYCAAALADYQAGVSAYRRGDFAVAAREFRDAAAQSDRRAQLNLGLLYDRGEGVNQDYALAVHWYTMAAESGSVLAQVNLGAMVFEGLGTEQSYAIAAGWFRRAAMAHSATAQYNLAYMYEQGLGVEPDLVQAYAWLLIARSHDDSIAQKELDDLAARLSPAEVAQARELYDTYFETRNTAEGSQ